MIMMDINPIIDTWVNIHESGLLRQPVKLSAEIMNYAVTVIPHEAIMNWKYFPHYWPSVWESIAYWWITFRKGL